MAARLDATDVSSVERIIAGLRLAETGMRLWERMQQPQQLPQPLTDTLSLFGGFSATASATVKCSLADEPAMLTNSVSALCQRLCEAILVLARGSPKGRAELLDGGVAVALTTLQSAVQHDRSSFSLSCYRS